MPVSMDNGPEFAGRALDEWAYRNGVRLNFIRLGKPMENAFAESLIGRLRDDELVSQPKACQGYYRRLAEGL